MNEWKPIETAPRGEPIIVGSGHPGHSGEPDGWVTVETLEPGEDVTGWKMRPTHWMPLPSPPPKTA